MMSLNRMDVRFLLATLLCLFYSGCCEVTIQNCPDDQTININRAYWEPPTATSASGAVTLTTSHTPGSVFPNGVTIVTYEAGDDNGNIDDSCTFRIIVDNSNAPTVSDCPTTQIEVTATAAGQTFAAATWTEPTAKATNGDNVTWTYRSHEPGEDFYDGTTPVLYEFVDDENNGALCTFDVVVTVPLDTVGPTVECPDDMTIMVAEGETETAVTWDDVVPTGEYELFFGTQTSGDMFSVGNTVVRYHVEDAAGNEDECEFTVTVSVIIPDTTPPTFTYCPENINELVGPNQDTVVVIWNDPTATDEETATDDITITSNIESPYTAQVENSVTVTYTATDKAGNDRECIFTVTVSVDGVPTFENCPTNIVVEMTGVNTEATWTEPIVTDDSTVTSNYDPGDTFTGPAEYTVTYMAIDPFGSTATCSFVVRIQDTTAPTIQGCPSDIVRTVTGVNTVSVTWTEPTAEDNSGRDVVITSDINSGATFTNGDTITVTYTVTDLVGLSTTCDFTVTVTGTTACSDNPCENDGVCTTDGETGFECICVDDYTGETCSNSGLSTLQIIAIVLGSLAGLLLLLLFIICCCYYCCFIPYGEEEEEDRYPREIIVHQVPQKQMHMGGGVLPEPRQPVYDNRPPGARFHNSLPKIKSKRGRRFRHKNYTSSKVKDATTKNYGRHRDYMT
ncbi:hyalin-like [Antedon mediterranea]|uniref:hyalin-like n=1 Tax=Antedon mediterranea TaxID=105859 RepID=UPI003AF89BBF